MLFRPFVRSWVIEDIEGDLNELYTERLEKYGKFRADLGYLVDLITMLNLYKTRFKISNNMKSLFIHHLKTSIRGFQRRKEYFLINTIGLVMAMAAVILISLHIHQEFSYDRFHKNGDKIVRLAFNQSLMTSAPMGPHLAEKFPEIEAMTRMNFPFQPLRLKHENSVYNVSDLAYVDPDFFKVFTFPLVEGNEVGLLSSKDQVAISHTESVKLFGQEDPIGQLLTVNDSLDVVVRAVFEDMPKNSSIQVDYLLPFDFQERMGRTRNLQQWGRFSYYTFFLLNSEDQLTEVEADIDQEIKGLFASSGQNPDMHLQVMREAHFSTIYANDLAFRGDMKMIKIYLAAGLLVLIIACINFVNLSAAIVGKRVKEIGVRKVLGAFRSDLIRQYLTETAVFVTFSFVLGLLVALWVLPYFNQYLGHQLVIDLFSTEMAVLFIVYLLLTTILTGVYPAYLFASLRSVDAIQGKVKLGKRSFRRVLVTLQFGFSLVLLILTLVTKNQIRFIQDFDPGYDREQVIVMPLYGHIHDEFKTIKTELLRSSLIESVSASASMPINNLTSTSSNSLRWEGKDLENEFPININWVEEEYLDLFDIAIKSGQGFKEFLGSTETLMIVNQRLVDEIGMDNPLGFQMSIWGQKGRIVGVTEDFNFESVRTGIEPMLIILEREYYEYAYIRYQQGKPLEAIGLIEQVAKGVDGNYVLNLSFLDSEFQELYEEEQRTNALLTVFSTLAILISAMGLFGFITFVVQSRMKEVSIRKVLGASTKQLAGVISREFLIMLAIASVLAWPVALYLAKGWLADFEYRVNVGAYVFIIATVLLLLVTLAVIAGQLIKVLRANPAKILRRE